MTPTLNHLTPATSWTDTVHNWTTTTGDALREALGFVGNLYSGLPLWVIPMFWLALIMIVLSLVFLLVLVAKAQSQYRKARKLIREDHDPAETEADYLWVFMVPALNEAVTIADSVDRLNKVEVTHSRILVINDGSDDRTGEILDNLSARIDRLTVLTRVHPNARQGKSEALNDAWRFLHNHVLTRGKYAGWNPAKVIVAIVDADGRLDPTAGRVARHFTDERVGGVQSQVRIYNRESLLTLAQDVEFGVFGSVFQLGRTGWGTANMGGNGQFNRLSALDSVAVQDSHGRIGPWRAGRLTEDQDIGLRLIHNGWKGEQSTEVSINQQGLNSLRALMRQRTRWSQGTWQVFDLIRPSLKNPHISLRAKTDQFWYLLTPLIQAWLGFVLVLSLAFLALGVVEPHWSWILVIVLYMFAAMPSIIGVLFTHRRRGFKGFLVNIAFAHLYLVYSWMIYPVVYRALFRQLTGARSWAKTAREQIKADESEVDGLGVDGAGVAGVGVGSAGTTATAPLAIESLSREDIEAQAMVDQAFVDQAMVSPALSSGNTPEVTQSRFQPEPLFQAQPSQASPTVRAEPNFQAKPNFQAEPRRGGAHAAPDAD